MEERYCCIFKAVSMASNTTYASATKVGALGKANICLSDCTLSLPLK